MSGTKPRFDYDTSNHLVVVEQNIPVLLSCSFFVLTLPRGILFGILIWLTMDKYNKTQVKNFDHDGLAAQVVQFIGIYVWIFNLHMRS